MNIRIIGDISAVQPGFGDIAADLELKIADNGKEVRIGRADKGFSVVTKGDKTEISYDTPADLFRATAILADALKGGYDVNITQQPAFDKCGIMLDVSRGAILKVDTVKDIMRRIARMGFNELMLYTEDTYELEGYPYFGYMRGRYTEEEICEIVAYGNTLGIETVPCIQTLGHLLQALRWAAFNGMRDQPAVLLIGEEKVYKLIDAMLKTARRCFTSNKIHIGMDEAHGVGLGTYLQKHGFKNRFEIMSAHLKRVNEMCKEYGFEPMMWSDMFFRLADSDNQYYSPDACLPDNIAELIPEGVSQVYWDYYNNSEKMYNVMMREHNRMGCPIIFAGGVWIWSGPSVNNRQSIESTLPALKVCKEQGVKNVFATLWGDDGCECDIYEALYGLQLYAEYNYDSENAMKNLDKMFEICNGFDAESFKLFDIDDFGLEMYSPDRPEFLDLEGHIVNTSKQVLYQNPLLGLFDRNFEGEPLREHYEKIAAKLDKANIPENEKLLFDVHKLLVKILTSKCDIGIRLKKAYDAKDKNTLEKLSVELKSLAGDIDAFRVMRRKLWYKRSKPFGFEKVNMRLSSSATLTHLAHERIEEYLTGKVKFLDELEQERLYYNSIERAHFMVYGSIGMQMPML